MDCEIANRQNDRGAVLIQFDVAALPKPRPRPRDARGAAQIYTPHTADDWMFAVRAACIAARRSTGAPYAELTGEPVLVEIAFRMWRPKSHFRTGRFVDELKPTAPVWHHIKPDADNLAKSTLDALGEWGGASLIWVDDAQVVDLRVVKRYAAPGELPGAAVWVRSAGPMPEVVWQSREQLGGRALLLDATEGERARLDHRRSGLTQAAYAAQCGVTIGSWRLRTKDSRKLSDRILRRLTLGEWCWIQRARVGETMEAIGAASLFGARWVGLAERDEVPAGALVSWWVADRRILDPRLDTGGLTE